MCLDLPSVAAWQPDFRWRGRPQRTLYTNDLFVFLTPLPFTDSQVGLEPTLQRRLRSHVLPITLPAISSLLSSVLYLICKSKLNIFKLWLRFTLHEPSRSIQTHSIGSYSDFSLFAMRHHFPHPRLGRLSSQLPRSYYWLILLKIFNFNLHKYYIKFLFFCQSFFLFLSKGKAFFFPLSLYIL